MYGLVSALPESVDHGDPALTTLYMERGKRMEDPALQPRIIGKQNSPLGGAAELKPEGDVSAHPIGVIRL